MKQLFEYLISKENKKKINFTRNFVENGFLFKNGDIIEVYTNSNNKNVEYFIFCDNDTLPTEIGGKSEGYGIFLRSRTASPFTHDGHWKVRYDDYNNKLEYIKNDAIDPDALSVLKLWRTNEDPTKNWDINSMKKLMKEKYLIFKRQ